MVDSLAHPAALELEAETGLSVGAPHPIRFHVQLPQPNHVDLWIAPLDLSSTKLAELEGTLSSNELDRAHRFRFQSHRHRYIAAHGWLRSVLGAYLARSAETVEFVLNPKGKPDLLPSSSPDGLRFNLAHSESFAAIAVTKSCDVGVDIEQVRPIPDAGDLVNRFFSQRESIAFHALPEDQRSTAFFNLWTRKEAWLKATGEGIAHLLKHVEVSFIPGHPVKLLQLPPGYDADSSWSLQATHPRPGVVVAVAAKCVPLHLTVRWADTLSECGHE